MAVGDGVLLITGLPITDHRSLITDGSPATTHQSRITNHVFHLRAFPGKQPALIQPAIDSIGDE